jgi:hypothetical protein
MDSSMIEVRIKVIPMDFFILRNSIFVNRTSIFDVNEIGKTFHTLWAVVGNFNILTWSYFPREGWCVEATQARISSLIVHIPSST